MRWRGFRTVAIFERILERERALLSRIPGDPTFGGLWSEKEKRSTQDRLRVDSGIGSFFKLLEVGVSPYLSFIPSLSVFQCFGWIEAFRGRLIGPKPWDRINIKFGNKMG